MHLRTDLEANLNKQLVRACSRFRLSCHDLRVETGRYDGIQWSGRVCNKCGCGHIQDEMHMVFECEASLHIRGRWYNLFSHASHGDMKGFMKQDDDVVSKFIYEATMNFVAEQPNQAEGSPQSPRLQANL